jgi:hypothetical protein
MGPGNIPGGPNRARRYVSITPGHPNFVDEACRIFEHLVGENINRSVMP